MLQENPLSTKAARDKISIIQFQKESILDLHKFWIVPLHPGRDVRVVTPEEMPIKRGLSYKEGQARLLHDLASIELQAMELGLRGLLEFHEADPQFREDLLRITLEESRHLSLCLDAIESLGFKWGQWPVHNLLWQAVSPEDSLLDRIMIVHRYLEGSGLDAGETLLRRLKGVKEGIVHTTVETIVREEIAHVDFGSRWYREICRAEGRDPQQDFPSRLEKLRHQLPKRIEPLSIELRTKAGFTPEEIKVMRSYRDSLLGIGSSAKKQEEILCASN